MVAPVPDDEDPRVVAVQAEPVGAVVDAVVGRGVEHPVQRAQARDQLGVDPATVQYSTVQYSTVQRAQARDQLGVDPGTHTL